MKPPLQSIPLQTVGRMWPQTLFRALQPTATNILPAPGSPCLPEPQVPQLPHSPTLWLFSVSRWCLRLRWRKEPASCGGFIDLTKSARMCPPKVDFWVVALSYTPSPVAMQLSFGKLLGSSSKSALDVRWPSILASPSSTWLVLLLAQLEQISLWMAIYLSGGVISSWEE